MGSTEEKAYIAIDLKSFYASVEAHDMGYDPLDVNLVVADESRTEKTICLAVSPALKSYGVPGRARLFEVVQRVKEINADRLRRAPGGHFTGESNLASELAKDPSLKLGYVAARPRMALYMDISTKIFGIYLRYVSEEDVHVYSVDEIFIDATSYLKLYGLTARDFTMKLIREVLSETGITATAGIGTNLYLCKIAMDIVAKHMPADKDGVRIAELDEMSYRRMLWDHRPISDFWRVGKGISRRLAGAGMYTMGDVARCSVYNEDLLYKMFGVNAELLIDHAWGWEPCTIKDIKSYIPESSSLSSGQVLSSPYSVSDARLVMREMADLLAMDLMSKHLVTDQIVLTIIYDVECLLDPDRKKRYKGPVDRDWYGRLMPKAAHGSVNIPGGYTSSVRAVMDSAARLYDSIVDPDLLVRRIYIVANHTLREGSDELVKASEEQLDIFTVAEAQKQSALSEEELKAERDQQEAVLAIRKKYGKNAIVRGMDLQEAATAMERNAQVGGHKA
ncbi:MAG: DNA methylase [Firmicutes bacterium]|nr:DNA methylase [Bacillota bacterium]